MPKSDALGYYRALNISPTATQEEIRLAYKFLKRAYQEKGKRNLNINKIRTAYETLSDPTMRDRYNKGESSRMQIVLKRVRKKLDSVGLLVTLAVTLCLLLALFFGPMLKTKITHYSPGDSLVWSADHRPLGTVLSFEADHAFPNGLRAPAYRIDPAEGGAATWYPAKDLQRHCSK